MACRTCSGVTSGASSTVQKPVGVMSKTPRSVMTRLTTAAPVSGSVQARRSFGAPLRGVLHDDDDAADAGDEIHCAAHAFDALAGDHPVGEVAAFGDLHGAEDGEVDVAAADHGEGVGAGEGGGAGGEGDGLLAGVDEVGVDFVLRAERDPCRAGRFPIAA